MGAIRPLERDDISEAASLYERVARSGSSTPPSGLIRYFERTFLDYPWADPEIPSLVYVDDDGGVAGFLGSSVRRLVFDGSPIRLGVSGQLVTDPGVRNRAVGAFLMKEYMNGPQELTLTDTASATVRRIWEGIGGQALSLCCVGWVRVFRPVRLAADVFDRRGTLTTLAARGRPVWSGVDAALGLVARPVLRPTDELPGEVETLTPQALAEHVQTVTASLRLRPEYEDEVFGRWLLAAIDEIPGTLVARLVRTGGRVRGWFVYVRRGDVAYVLQVASDGRSMDDVLDHLFHDAWSSGVAAVQGRVEPHLLEPLSRRRAMFHASGYVALIQSRDPQLLHAIEAGQALLTRLEGEWWMGHHLLEFKDDREG
jgi:hypothetical protein